ncbi:IS1381, transposase OrfA [Streptococcus pneumoniae]|nr:IS1381, transposase OrfA [Streptococcus pneumoniae]
MDLKFEGVDLEYKKAKNNLPESFWETYSAFANTNGGKIILGIDEKNIDTYQRVNRLPAKQNYEASKQLTDARFKRLVGVQRTTFEEMLAVLKTAYQLKHAKGGRKPKLSLEDLLMATLQYVREYRTYEEIAADFGIHESNLIRRSQWVEVTLVQSGVTISKTHLSAEDTVIVDATEVKINRPKKTISESFW